MNEDLKSILFGLLVTAGGFGACYGLAHEESKLIEGQYKFIWQGSDLRVRQSTFPYNEQINWIDKKDDGNLEAVALNMATGRGMGHLVLKEGDEGFEEARRFYRDSIYPLAEK